MRVRPLLGAAVLALLSASACAAPLQGCRLRGLEHEAMCGVVKRPLDPAQPGGRQVDIHYAVIPALARNKLPDPVFFFAGGPGQSAIDLAGAIAGQLSRMSNRRDIVLVDQRGTGRSAPLQCADDDPARPLGQQLDPARQTAALLACRDALKALPYGDLRMFTTTLAVQDIDAVRAALGAERIDVMGVSYGTRVVLEYQRQFPQHVRRAVIDGVAPPDMALPASFSTDNQAALDGWLDACERDAACNARHPKLRARWQSMLAGLPKQVTLVHPVTGQPEAVTVTRDLVIAMVRAPLYLPAAAAALPQAIDDASAGRFEGLAALASLLHGPRKTLALAEGMHFSVVCAEDAPRMASAPDRPGADFGDSFARQYREVCAVWPRGEVPAEFYRLASAQTATLVLSGAIDPVTPPRHGERVAKALGAKARSIVVPNAGHGVGSIGCMRDVVYRFIEAESDSDALAVDARCMQGVPRPPAFVPIQPPAPASAASAATVPGSAR